MISILRAEQGNELESCHVGEGSVDVGLLGEEGVEAKILQFLDTGLTVQET